VIDYCAARDIKADIELIRAEDINRRTSGSCRRTCATGCHRHGFTQIKKETQPHIIVNFAGPSRNRRPGLPCITKDLPTSERGEESVSVAMRSHTA